ncbi:hypothetical protein Taro_025106 [Colocasia esculenta]|uniref:Uncharacterized protein n=1 Tax=Colocasia esculenta TaxID=4460 RepID=A0A843VBB4_COLES|nr:hypothetical protein [Colocasia esculenta]
MGAMRSCAYWACLGYKPVVPVSVGGCPAHSLFARGSFSRRQGLLELLTLVAVGENGGDNDCVPASPSHYLTLCWFRSCVGRSGVGPQLGRAAVVCGCVLCCGSLASLYLGRLQAGVGGWGVGGWTVCPLLSSRWQRLGCSCCDGISHVVSKVVLLVGPRPCGWSEVAVPVVRRCLLTWLFGVSHDDTWLFLPDLVEGWDVGACVVRLWSNAVALVFHELLDPGCGSWPCSVLLLCSTLQEVFSTLLLSRVVCFSFCWSSCCSGRDSLSQEFITERSWWRFVASCVASSVSCERGAPVPSSDPWVAVRPLGSLAGVWEVGSLQYPSALTRAQLVLKFLMFQLRSTTSSNSNQQMISLKTDYIRMRTFNEERFKLGLLDVNKGQWRMILQVPSGAEVDLCSVKVKWCDLPYVVLYPSLVRPSGVEWRCVRLVPPAVELVMLCELVLPRAARFKVKYNIKLSFHRFAVMYGPKSSHHMLEFQHYFVESGRLNEEEWAAAYPDLSAECKKLTLSPAVFLLKGYDNLRKTSNDKWIQRYIIYYQAKDAAYSQGLHWNVSIHDFLSLAARKKFVPLRYSLSDDKYHRRLS